MWGVKTSETYEALRHYYEEFRHTIIIPLDTHKFFIDKLREVGETVSGTTAL